MPELKCKSVLRKLIMRESSECSFGMRPQTLNMHISQFSDNLVYYGDEPGKKIFPLFTEDSKIKFRFEGNMEYYTNSVIIVEEEVYHTSEIWDENKIPLETIVCILNNTNLYEAEFFLDNKKVILEFVDGRNLRVLFVWENPNKSKSSGSEKSLKYICPRCSFLSDKIPSLPCPACGYPNPPNPPYVK